MTDGKIVKETEEIKDKKEDVKYYKAIEVVAKSEGGEYLINDLKQKIADNVNTLEYSFLTLPEAQLRAICANISALLGLLRVLNKSEKNVKIKVEELSELLEENKE